MTTPPAVRVWESHMTLLKRIWKTNLTLGFVQPILFLLGMGLGVGSLVDARTASSDALGGMGYLAFLAPALLATTAMLVGAFESTYPVLAGFKWEGTFDSMAATSLTTRQIVAGQLLWWATRVSLAVVGVTVVLVVVPDTRSWGLVPATLSAVLCGLSFSTTVGAYAATREYDQSFNYVQRFVVTPLFLFGGAFYPIEALPGILKPIAWVTPLWHGVELTRGFVLETIGFFAVLGHLAVLFAYITLGLYLCDRYFTRRLYR
ncbi:MAG: ABC transporter permease [Acidimicrobiia bacterium]|nr:ABC transporter permease [Acidimicrobiia bacterium]